MPEQPRDGDRELANIDRVIATQGDVPPPAPAPSAPGRPPVPPPGPMRRRSVALTWFWALLAVALGVALVFWPYQRTCGLQLIFFLGAAGITALIAVLGALASWAHHRGLAHVLSLLVLLWAGFVVVREVLPRVGYARTSLTWTCPAQPAAPTQNQPATSPSGAAPAAPGTEAPAPR